MRISTFFDVVPEELTLLPGELQKIHRTRASNGLLAKNYGSQHFMPSPSGPHELDQYCGFYRTFQKVPYFDTNILMGLCEIKRYGNVFLSKFLENASSDQLSEGASRYSKMVGIVTYEGGYIYILDHKPQSRPSYSLTVLFLAFMILSV